MAIRLVTYIESSLSCSKINIENRSSIWEGLFVSVKDNYSEKEFVIGNIYRPPYNNNNEDNINTFISELNPIIGKLNDNNRNMIIAGDFNINLLHINMCNKEHFGNFLDMMLGYSLFPKITHPTRLGENSCSLIDNIFCTLSPSIIHSNAGILHSRISDHFPCYISIRPNKFRLGDHPKYVKQRIKSPQAYNALLKNLTEVSIADSLDSNPYCDPNENYNILHETLTKLKDKHLPYKFVKFNKHRHKNNKWITYGIIRSIKYRDKMYRDLKCMDNSTITYVQFKNQLDVYNKILKKAIREAKTIYYNNEFDKNKNNIRRVWGTINEIISKKNKKESCIKTIIKDGKRIRDPKKIVETFNNFFINIGPNLTKNMEMNQNKHFLKFLNQNILTSFSFTLRNEEQIKKVIYSLHTKHSSGHDGISVKLLKFLAPALVRPLTLIINQSLITGIFPDKLKVAKVIPLYKKDDKLIMDNYRPISLLSSISKVFEKVVFLQLSSYFIENNLFHDGQYGFREKHSTELATMELMDRVISALDDKDLPISIFMDLSKAFDTLDHTTLLHKLKYYGINGITLNWFNSYLSNRSQYVEIDNVLSTKMVINTGVPQGSILGPLLFLIYMNDIPNSSQAFRFVLYADDTTLFSTIEYTIPIDSSDVNYLLNRELSLVYEWLLLNKLSLNVKKTKFMLFHPYQKDVSNLVPVLKINQNEIEKVDKFDFLGVTLDEHVNWKAHTDKLATRLSKYSGILNKLKNYLPPYILRTLYCSLVQSHLNYAILTWGYSCNRLEKLQKRLIRIITWSKYNAHTKPLLKQLELLKLSDLLELSALKFYFKYLHGSLPRFFYSFNIATQGTQHSHETRQRDQLRVDRSRINLADNRIRIFLPTLVNSTPLHLLHKITTHSIQGFSSHIKRYLINRYRDNCSNTNCYVCQY